MSDQPKFVLVLDAHEASCLVTSLLTSWLTNTSTQPHQEGEDPYRVQLDPQAAAITIRTARSLAREQNLDYDAMCTASVGITAIAIDKLLQWLALPADQRTSSPHELDYPSPESDNPITTKE